MTSADDRAHYLAGNGSGDGTYALQHRADYRNGVAGAHLIGAESQGVMACGVSGR
jgi:hypothetical protein